MTTDPETDHRAPLSLPAVLMRLGLIGVVVIVAAATFAYVGGWFTRGI
jgi:hypothetical protein